MNDHEYEQELQRRLAVIESPDYVDPARRDLPGKDILLLIVGAAVVIATAWIWGYPA